MLSIVRPWGFLLKKLLYVGNDLLTSQDVTVANLNDEISSGQYSVNKPT